MKRKLAGLLLMPVLMVSLVVTGCPVPVVEPEPEKWVWRFQCAFPPGDVSHDQLPFFADLVYEKTEGRLRIEIFPGGALVPVDEMLTALGKGVFEMLHASGGYWKGILPVAALDSGLPFQYRGFGCLEGITELFHEAGLIEIFREAYAEHNAYYLGFVSYSASPIIASTVPIRSLADYEGVKVRTFGPLLEYFGKFGAATVWFPGAEIYMALKLGTVDAATWTIDLIIGMKIHEVIDYLILPPFLDHGLGQCLVNMDAWEALPRYIQQAVKDAWREYAEKVFRLYHEEWELVLARGDELGYEVIMLPDACVEEMRRLAMPFWDEFVAKCDFSARVIAIIKDFYEIER